MNINDLFINDGNSEALRHAMLNVKGVLQMVAHDYARAALDASNETLNAVHAAAPCAAVWPHMLDYQKYTQRAQQAMTAATQATGMLLMAEETGDDEIDDINRDVKVTSMDFHVAASLLEGANARMTLAMQGVPNNGAPGQRCNPEAAMPPQTETG